MRPSSHLALTHLVFDGQQHKNEHWVKMLLVVAPHGYIMHVGGPYAPAGKATDASIMTYELLHDGEFWNFGQRGGTWLGDYGFRGVRVPAGVQCYLPKKWDYKHGVQATQAEADHNAILCSARWVVEADNERIENFQFFNGRKRAITETKHLLAFVRGVAFLFNRWNKPILSS